MGVCSHSFFAFVRSYVLYTFDKSLVPNTITWIVLNFVEMAEYIADIENQKLHGGG